MATYSHVLQIPSDSLKEAIDVHERIIKAIEKDRALSGNRVQNAVVSGELASASQVEETESILEARGRNSGSSSSGHDDNWRRNFMIVAAGIISASGGSMWWRSRSSK